MPLNDSERNWYYDQIERLDPHRKVVALDRAAATVTYQPAVRTDQNRCQQADAEQLVHALAMCLLASSRYRYGPVSFYHEKHLGRAHPGSKRNEVDLIVYDDDNLPFAVWEFKCAEEYGKDRDKHVNHQLFHTAPLVGSPKWLVYATVRPGGPSPAFTLMCIDRSEHHSYDAWVNGGRPHSQTFPPAFTDPTFEPLVKGGEHDLRFDCTLADFRAVAAAIHDGFFSEHPDTTLFANIAKCLLAKIYDEKSHTRNGEPYSFQVFCRKGKEQSAADVFARINALYKNAYSRYIDPHADAPDQIEPKELPPEEVKSIVRLLQGMALTKGAALHADVIGAFFEEILRSGFKQDKGMYFTHANLAAFILEALDLDGLAVQTWQQATHPEDRLPYIIDPSCGSGTFLMRAMSIVTNAIRSRRQRLVNDDEAADFFRTRMSDNSPNCWAEHFIYGIDPKFVMAIIAKVNMVLHGDGSAHIFKRDALGPLSAFADGKLKPAGDVARSVSRADYAFDTAEAFDVVVSNPPFGVTLAPETAVALPNTFSLKESLPSECLFLERWFQLLKPGGRLGVVVPESLLNTADCTAARLLLYRFFWVRAVVALPRNLFVDTPTLTSLLFAQKKSKEEIEAWDAAWATAAVRYAAICQEATNFLHAAKKSRDAGPEEIAQGFLRIVSAILGSATYITKKGYAPVPVRLPEEVTTSAQAARHYESLLKLAGFKNLLRNATFADVCRDQDYEYPAYLGDEVGFKLSKRRERPRPNQLCRFVGVTSKKEQPNLHLADEPVQIEIDLESPARILDYLRRDVKWA